MMNREGLTLTRCDVCNRRTYCAVDGLALCVDCCPGAVEQAIGTARQKRLGREARRIKASEITADGRDIWLPPA